MVLEIRMNKVEKPPMFLEIRMNKVEALFFSPKEKKSASTVFAFSR